MKEGKGLNETQRTNKKGEREGVEIALVREGEI